jgi:hypothetical protein
MREVLKAFIDLNYTLLRHSVNVGYFFERRALLPRLDFVEAFLGGVFFYSPGLVLFSFGFCTGVLTGDWLIKLPIMGCASVTFSRISGNNSTF